MDIITIKVLAGVLFLCIVALFAGFPFFLLRKFAAKFRSSENQSGGGLPWISFLHATAAGVLVATCLLSLLPEAIEAVHESIAQTNRQDAADAQRRRRQAAAVMPAVNETNPYIENGNFRYPFAELIIAMGFLLVYMLDSTYRWMRSRSQHFSGWTETTDALDGQIGVYEMLEKERPRDLTDFFSSESKDGASAANGEPAGEEAGVVGDGSLPPVSELTLERDVDLNGGEEEDPTADYPEPVGGVASGTGGVASGRGATSGAPQAGSGVEEHPLAAEYAMRRAAQADRSRHVRAGTLVAALCIHGAFDGILLGLQTSLHVLLSLALALAVHKAFVSLSVAVTLFNSHGSDEGVARVTISLVIFALTAPLGLCISAGVVHGAGGEDESSGLLGGVVQAAAVGSFMYVALTELMQRRPIKSLTGQLVGHACTVAGFALMAGVRAALGEV